MNFTPNQLGFLAFYFFKEATATMEQWAEMAAAIHDFIKLGDPYDAELVFQAMKFVFPEFPANDKNILKFVGKVIYWYPAK